MVIWTTGLKIAGLETTNRYAELTLRMKTEALAQCEPPTQPFDSSLGKPHWRDNADLLKWLDSLLNFMLPKTRAPPGAGWLLNLEGT